MESRSSGGNGYKSDHLEMMTDKDGFVLADKPEGMGSATLVDKLKRKAKIKKAGHTGTLDRFASGLMVLVTGRATSFADSLLHRDKTYKAEIAFGRFTDTHDPSGETIDSRSDEESRRFVKENKDEIRSFLEGLVEHSEQKPPVYSALKKSGKRYSDLAREGQDIELKNRPIRVFSSEILGFDDERATVSFTVRVSAGTYIRSFARDLSEAIGFPAHLSRLVRTALGDISLEHPAVWKEDPETGAHDGKNVIILPVKEVLSWPLISVDGSAVDQLRHGRIVPVHPLPENRDFFLVDREENILAWAVRQEKGYRYRKVFGGF